MGAMGAMGATSWRMLPHHIDSTIHLAQIPALLYNSSLPIFKSKWDGLHNLKYVIPTEFYHFITI